MSRINNSPFHNARTMRSLDVTLSKGAISGTKASPMPLKWCLNKFDSCPETIKVRFAIILLFLKQSQHVPVLKNRRNHFSMLIIISQKEILAQRAELFDRSDDEVLKESNSYIRGPRNLDPCQRHNQLIIIHLCWYEWMETIGDSSFICVRAKFIPSDSKVRIRNQSVSLDILDHNEGASKAVANEVPSIYAAIVATCHYWIEKNGIKTRRSNRIPHSSSGWIIEGYTIICLMEN